MIGLEKTTLKPIWFTRLMNNNKENNMTITQEQFDAYVEVQESGITNMFNVSVVSDYSGLSRQDIMTIMSNYSALQEKYGN